MATRSPTKKLNESTSAGKLGSILPWILIIAGIIGTIAAVMITVEKFDLIQNPSYRPACDLNPVISCGSVMQSKQAYAFGFMNTYIGIIGFPVLVTVGVAALAGAKFKRWFWLCMQIGLGLGIIFAYWLLYESIYSINALCPYCLSVDVVLTTAFWYTLLYNLRTGTIKLPGKLKTANAFAQRNHLGVLLLWFIIVIFFILKHFWYYYGHHL